jgi:outer membrane protein assembly factor BamB
MLLGEVRYDRRARRYSHVRRQLRLGHQGVQLCQWFVSLISISLVDHIKGTLLFNYSPKGYNAYQAIFSSTTPNLVFAASKRATERINISDGSVTQFTGGPTRVHSCLGNPMTLNGYGSVLYIGYSEAACVVAYNVSTCQQIWTTQLEDAVSSLSYLTEGLLIVGTFPSKTFVLCEEHGSLLRKFIPSEYAFVTHAIIKCLKPVYDTPLFASILSISLCMSLPASLYEL